MIDKTFSYFEQNSYEFSINLSVEDILDKKTVAFILDKLERSSIAKRVIFEIQTIAEFVHSKEVYEIIKEIGVDFSQGFYFHEPSPSL